MMKKQQTKKQVKQKAKQQQGSIYRQRERRIKGVANHRRIQIMELLAAQPELNVIEIADRLDADYQTVAHHVQKLARSGMVLKRTAGNHVRQALSPLGKRTLTFLRTLD